MALFKILKGKKNNLNNKPIKEGYCYFTEDEAKLYIDTATQRLPLNAANADTIASCSVETSSLSGSEDKIPNSAVVTANLNTITDRVNTHTHTVTHKPAGSISSTFTGEQSTHGHSFTGTEKTITASYTPSGNVSISTTAVGSGQTATYTPAGSVSSHSHTPTVTATSVYSITGVGTLPSCTMPTMSSSINNNRCMTISLSAGSFSAGSLPTRSSVSVATDVSIANTQPTFTGTGIMFNGAFTGTAGTATGTYTPEGTIANTSITPEGSISSTFTGTSATLTTSAAN